MSLLLLHIIVLIWELAMAEGRIHIRVVFVCLCVKVIAFGMLIQCPLSCHQ